MPNESEQVLLSVPARRFLDDSRSLTTFILFMIKNMKRLDDALGMIAKVALSLPDENTTAIDDVTKAALSERAAGTGGTALGTWMSYVPLQSELFLCRMTDNFLTYISELLTLIFSTRQEMLTSKDTIGVKEALGCATREELIGLLTERKVLSLSFKGLKDLQDDLTKKHKFVLFTDTPDFDRASVLIEKRNLFTHNRGYVNRRYRDHVKDAAEAVGEKLAIEMSDLLDDLDFLTNQVIDIDDRAEVKFKIPRNERVRDE